MKELVMQSVTAHFRPEFINRVDDIVVFHALKKEQVRKIANIQIDRLRQRLSEQGLKLEVDDSALDLIGDAGFDPVYGARPLKRSIQMTLENPLAEKILAGDLLRGDTIAISVESGALVFTKR